MDALPGRLIGVIPSGSDRTASLRYRVLQFLPFLELAGLGTRLLRGVPDATRFPVYWIQKKLLPRRQVRALARGGRLVFDFDDAIWTTEKGQRSFFVRWRTEARLRSVLRHSAAVLAGNEYLAAYARRHNPRVAVVPTVLDTERYPARQHGPCDVLTLGWIGHSVNFPYLAALGPVLRSFAAQCPARLLVVADRDFALEGVEVVNRRWSEASEVADLLDMDVGLMPLVDDEWTRGKCGFKAVQYMAAGVPPVASPVGMNRDLVSHGQDGFLAAADADWLEALRQLHADAGLRERMGRAAREKVQQRYSLAATGPAIARIFRELLDGSPE
jgi:glycosyltransferase involved in cell wall biosynthesis